MSEEKKLPRVLLLRVQNALQKTVIDLYSTDKENIVRAVLESGESVYYDLVAKKVVSSMQDWGAEDTLKLTGGKQPEEVKKPVGVYDAVITREGTVETKPKTKSTVKKSGGKKTITKKASK